MWMRCKTKVEQGSAFINLLLITTLFKVDDFDEHFIEEKAFEVFIWNY